QDTIPAKEIDLDLHGITKPAKDVDVIPGFLVITMRRIIIDPDLMIKIAIQFGAEIGAEDVLEHTQFRHLFGTEIIRFIEYIAVTVTEDIRREPAFDAKGTSLQAGRENGLHQGLTGFEILPANGCTRLFRQFHYRGYVHCEIRGAIQEGNTHPDSCVRIDHRWRDPVIVLF